MKKIYLTSIVLLFSTAIINIANAQTVTGSGTTNRVTKWTNGASSIIGDCSQLFENTASVGINTTTPDASSKLHINVSNTSPGGGTLRGLYITLPTSWTPTGAMTAITATGGQTNTTFPNNVNGIFTATLGSSSGFAANGGIIAGVSGNASSVTKIGTGPFTGVTSNIVGVSGSIACSAMTTSINAGSWGWVSAVNGSLSGTITSYPTLVKGAVSCVTGIDQINGSATTNSYTYAGHFRGRVYIGSGGPLASTSYFVQQVGTTHADFLLCVDGKIVGRKIVTTALNWADDELVNPATSDELEKEQEFVYKNGHLQKVPSEKEVLENGIEMSEMFPIQMRKIEQLFKYSFLFNAQVKQLQNTNEQLKTENENLIKELADLKSRVEKLENK